MNKRFRILRVLEYEGDREWIDDCIKRRGVKGTQVVGNRGQIREAILGDVAELLPREEKEDGK